MDVDRRETQSLWDLPSSSSAGRRKWSLVDFLLLISCETKNERQQLDYEDCIESALNAYKFEIMCCGVPFRI